jgi:hypothetical protein
MAAVPYEPDAIIIAQEEQPVRLLRYKDAERPNDPWELVQVDAAKPGGARVIM